MTIQPTGDMSIAGVSHRAECLRRRRGRPRPRPRTGPRGCGARRGAPRRSRPRAARAGAVERRVAARNGGATPPPRSWSTGHGYPAERLEPGRADGSAARARGRSSARRRRGRPDRVRRGRRRGPRRGIPTTSPQERRQQASSAGDGPSGVAADDRSPRLVRLTGRGRCALVDDEPRIAAVSSARAERRPGRRTSGRRRRRPARSRRERVGDGRDVLELALDRVGGRVAGRAAARGGRSAKTRAAREPWPDHAPRRVVGRCAVDERRAAARRRRRETAIAVPSGERMDRGRPGLHVGIGGRVRVVRLRLSR